MNECCASDIYDHSLKTYSLSVVRSRSFIYRYKASESCIFRTDADSPVVDH